MLRAQISELAFAAVQRAAPGGQFSTGRTTMLDQHRAARIEREQQAGLLEALAHRRHVVVEATLGKPEVRTGRGVVEPGTPDVTLPVSRLDHAARKDPGAAVAVAHRPG